MPKANKAQQPPQNQPFQEDYEYCNDDEFICAVRVFDNKNPKVFKNCAPNDDQIRRCHTLQGADVKLFELIDEKKLYPHFDKKMKDFVAILNTKLKDNEDMKNKIKSLYKVDIESDDNILLAQAEIGPNEYNCNDITGFVNLNTPKKYPLFHISIHPKASKYYKKQGTEAASCGYYSKRSEGSQGSGAFHYKIETLANGTKTTFKNKPYKKFMTADDAPGKFIKNKDNFVVSDEELIEQASDELHALHNFFYDEFIDFWNNRIVIDHTFRRSEPPAPEQLVPEPPGADEPLVPEPPGADRPLMDRKRASEDQSSTGQSEATEGLEPERKSSRKDPDQPPEIPRAGKKIRRKTIKKRKTKKRKPIKKRKTSKR
jgi:hypothetical protein